MQLMYNICSGVQVARASHQRQIPPHMAAEVHPPHPPPTPLAGAPHPHQSSLQV